MSVTSNIGQGGLNQSPVISTAGIVAHGIGQYAGRKAILILSTRPRRKQNQVLASQAALLERPPNQRRFDWNKLPPSRNLLPLATAFTN